MSDDETWTLSDSDGKTVVIVRRGADVLLDVGDVRQPQVTVRFEGVKRDLFVRCFMEAERRAEANAAQAVSGP